MMTPIVLGSTIKGVLTGVAAGLVARWRKSLALGVPAVAVVGFVLSAVAAIGQADHYWPWCCQGCWSARSQALPRNALD